MNRRTFIPTLICCILMLAILALAATPQSRIVQGAGIDLPSESDQGSLVAGNYCISCHLADDPRLAAVTEWRGGISREVNSLCPAATKVHEELYYTDRLLMMIERAQSTAGELPETAETRLQDYSQRYSRMLDTPVSSLDAFVSEAQTTRYQLNKVYTTLNEMIEADKARLVLIYAAVATLIVLGSLGWGLYNTRAIRAGFVLQSRATLWRALFVLAVLAFFALPIFRVPEAAVEMTTLEQQEAQTILDTAQRAADAADRAQARAWYLARIGAAWSALDEVQGKNLFYETQLALNTAQENDNALWGQSLAVQEASIGTPIEMESASLIAGDLNAARGRAWALPLIAVEWKEIDLTSATSLLQQGEAAAGKLTGIVRDLQLRSLALAWAEVDPAQAAPLAEQIAGPALRAWTMRELAGLTGESHLFDRAAVSARLILDPVRRAAALREIASAANQPALYAEALAALESASGAALAFALSDLAAASGDASLVEQIAPEYPDARASALLRLGEYSAAWEAAVLIDDTYEQAQAQAAIAGAWQNAEFANQIDVPLYRDLALKDVIQKTGNAALVDSISIPYYKVQALVATGDLKAAQKWAGDLGEPYPLVALAAALANTDPQAALVVVNQMDREADKASALQAIAVASQELQHFEQAQGMALASRVRGDALAPARASFELAIAAWDSKPQVAQSALQQAYEAVQRIAIK